MVKYGSVLFYYSLLIASIFCSATDGNRKLHIVYMGSLREEEYSPSSHHFNMLQRVVDNRFVENSLIKSYNKSFNAFAANLTTAEAQKLASMKEVVSVFPSTSLYRQTTRSWNFMGFEETIGRKNPEESNIIIGVIDSGIWPESKSFSDKGFGPVPKKWKGVCEGGKDFTCNNKIVGARYYSSTAAHYESARDDIGHGSHIASTAAGNIVQNASFYGLAEGTTRGGVPSARIAVYKVCHADSAGCSTLDIFAAFDDAIADGVDIITISLGADFAFELDRDVVAIGAFHAMEKGILTVQSAGNAGCGAGTVSSVAPWLLSVGASSIDRKFIDKVVLGNGSILTGLSINTFTMNGTMFPLVYGKDVSHQCSELDSQNCAPGCVDKNLVKGKIIICDFFDGVYEAYKAGALGAVVYNNRVDDASFLVPLPASALETSEMFMLQEYMTLTKNPTVNILRSEEITNLNSPIVASFSSCGPNSVIREIMKPDVVAPGVDILAAYSPISSPSDKPLDNRQVQYNILSGTSMACPHATGVAAYVKSIHPDWSPTTIKSAIMTTAWPMNNTSDWLGEFAHGSGHINPVKAAHPGLVYDADMEDYVKLLCGMGYDYNEIARIKGNNITCLDNYEKFLPIDFNYPSITFRVSPMVSFSFKFHRKVTNVGQSNSTYRAKLLPNFNITVQVQPRVLSFKSLHEKKSFVVTVEGQGIPVKRFTSTTLVWSDGIHSVRSPIIVFSQNTDD